MKNTLRLPAQQAPTPRCVATDAAPRFTVMRLMAAAQGWACALVRAWWQAWAPALMLLLLALGSTTAQAAITVSPTVLSPPTVGVPYNVNISASGGTAPYSYAITAGATPAGLSLAPNGTLAGTPTAAGPYSFTVTATDSSSSPETSSRAYSGTVMGPTMGMAPATVPNATVTVPYSVTLSASGGTAPYSYAITAGGMPAGLSLSSGGTLSGTPSVAGTSTVTITAADSTTGTGPYGVGRSYTITVLPYGGANANLSALALGSGTLAPAFAGGTMAYTASVPHAVDSVTLTPTVVDAGATVKVNNATVVSGAASGPLALNVGSNTLTVEVTAPDGTTKKTYTVTVTRAPLQSVAPSLPPGTPGAGMTLAVANSSATCTITAWNFSNPAAPSAPLPTGYTYPYAVVDFTAKQCDTSSTLAVTITFPNPVPPGAVLLKYDAAATPQWQPFTPAITGNQVRYTVVDGGLRDDDKLANGEFVDPVLLAVPLAVAPGGAVGIPTLGAGGLALLSLLAALAGALGLARGRAQRG